MRKTDDALTPEARIARLRNLGPASARWLCDAGIHSEAQLRAAGAVGAFRRVAMAGHRPSLNLAFAVEGALRNLHWNALPAEVRAAIRRELESPWNPADLQDVVG